MLYQITSHSRETSAGETYHTALPDQYYTKADAWYDLLRQLDYREQQDKDVRITRRTQERTAALQWVTSDNEIVYTIEKA